MAHDTIVPSSPDGLTPGELSKYFQAPLSTCRTAVKQCGGEKGADGVWRLPYDRIAEVAGRLGKPVPIFLQALIAGEAQTGAPSAPPLQVGRGAEGCGRGAAPPPAPPLSAEMAILEPLALGRGLIGALPHPSEQGRSSMGFNPFLPDNNTTITINMPETVRPSAASSPLPHPCGTPAELKAEEEIKEQIATLERNVEALLQTQPNISRRADEALSTARTALGALPALKTKKSLLCRFSWIQSTHVDLG